MVRTYTVLTLFVSSFLLAACGDNIEFGRDATPLFDGSATDDASSPSDAAPDDAPTGSNLTLTMTFGNFFDGDTLITDLRDDADNTVSLASTSGVIVGNSDLILMMPGVLSTGADYTLHYFVDRNDNMVCDGPLFGGNDRGWSQSFSNVAGDVDLTAATLDQRDNDCAP